MPHLVDLQSNGAGFLVNGTLGSCQLHWYNGTGCDEATHIGFMTGAEQMDGCMQPRDEEWNPIKELRSFSYVCEGDDLD